jgi:hypothetical protein
MMPAPRKREDTCRKQLVASLAGIIAGTLAMHWGARIIDPRPWFTSSRAPAEVQLIVVQSMAWVAAGGLWHALGRRLYGAPAGKRRTVAALRGALLAAFALGATHVGLTGADQAMVAVRDDASARGLVALGPDLPASFLGPRALAYRHSHRLDENWLRGSLQAMGAHGPEANRFVFYAADQQASEIMLILEGLSCTPPQTFTGNWPQRVGYYLTGKTDRGRAPVLLYQCSGSDMATTEPNFKERRT